MTRLMTVEPNGRDVQILRDLDRVRALTGRQIERLAFYEVLSVNGRGSARRRTMARLVRAGLVTTLPRRVGGERAGSAGLVYLLDRQGHERLHGRPERSRRPWPLGWPFVCHTLDVAELYVRLRELDRAGVVQLVQFEAEPASWFTVDRETIKPDAWVVYARDGWEQHRWLEVDRATESLPTLQRKLERYARLAASGKAGPLGVLPRVLLTVPDARRLSAVRSLIDALPVPELFGVSLFRETYVNTIRPPP